MDKYDPQKRIALIVDEWGTWYAVEPGTNPGFLYQQNTMRDAITAACNLNIFNNHCDRVRMANIAQIINVLQAMILTKDDKMVLTPTYHVFDMFKVHQNALYVKTTLEAPDYILGEQKLPAVNSSASIDDQGNLHISLCNIDPRSQHHISCSLKKFTVKSVSGRILTAKEMNAHNTFGNPSIVAPTKFSDATLSAKGIEVTLPPMSVVVLEVKGSCELTPSLELKDPKPGIKYSYYEGNWSAVPLFDSLVAQRTDVIDRFVLPEKNSGENFAVQYNGYIKIPKDGLYTFYTNSDDGTNLTIDNNVIVENDGLHAPQEQSGTSVLKAGFHEIQVKFFQGGGGKVLDVSIEGPELSKQIIPAQLLYH
jgi:alpha-N-arabinofuranosidase